MDEFPLRDLTRLSVSKVKYMLASGTHCLVTTEQFQDVICAM